MEQSLSRRAFFAAMVGAGTLAVPLAGSARAATITLYRLNSDWGHGDPNCVPNRGQSTCGGCYACVNHSRNKLFATAAAADAGRAHPGCKCLVEAECAIDSATYDQLFAAGPSVDRRTPGVNELVDCSVPTVSPTGTSSGTLALTGLPAVPLAVVGAGAVAVGAVLLRRQSDKTAGPVLKVEEPHR
jgi:hypothetical protein